MATGYYTSNYSYTISVTTTATTSDTFYYYVDYGSYGYGGSSNLPRETPKVASFKAEVEGQIKFEET